MLKRRQMCTAECAKILRRYNEMRLTSNDQRRGSSPTPKYRGSGLKRLNNIVIERYCIELLDSKKKTLKRRSFLTESYELNLHVVSCDVHVHYIHL